MPEQHDDCAALAGRRVLITGASGFIGSKLVERLITHGAQVAALSRSRGRLARITSATRVRFIECDVRDPDGVRRALAAFEPEILFHFATHPDGREGFAHVQDTIETNLAGTLHTLEAFHACGGELFLYGDSCKVYGNSPVPHREATTLNPASSYAISKAAGWDLARMYGHLHGIATVSLRPTLIYGPAQGRNLIGFVIERVLAGDDEVQLDGGTQTRDPLYIDDAIDAFVAAARRGRALDGRVINIGGGHEISVKDLGERIVAMFDRRVRVECCATQARPTEMWRSYCDNVEAASMIGWTPKIALKRGLQLTIAACVAERSKDMVAES